jgi:Sulfatase
MTTLLQAKDAAKSARGSSGKKPNILMIMGDDVGMWNISAYHRGMMGGRTSNIDRIAAEGALFTDYYAQQSCTAGRAAFITGQTPFRTGLLKVGMPAANHGIQDKDPTIAQLLKSLGLRHRANRQESSRRSQRVSAHRARVRRVLRHSLPLERYGRALR